MSEEVKLVDVTSTSDKKLEFTKSFRMEWRNPETDELLVGTFTCERPNLRKIGEIAIIKARLNAGERVNVDIDFLHEMFAYLQVVLTSVPEWWKPDEFFDASPVRKVWDYVRAWQESFRKKPVGERPGTAPGNSGNPTQNGMAAAVVVPEVQPTT